MKCVPTLTFVCGCSSAGGEAAFGWSWWKGLTQRMNIWRSWVVTWETHLPTAFLLVYWWRDDTEELGSTRYKASESAASYSLKDHCCRNLSLRNSPSGSRREAATLPSTMSEVGLFYVLKQRSRSILTKLRTIRAPERKRKHPQWDFCKGSELLFFVLFVKWWILAADISYSLSDVAHSCCVKVQNGISRYSRAH